MKAKEYKVSVTSKIFNPFTDEVVGKGFEFESSFEESTLEGYWNDEGYVAESYALDYDTHLTDIGLSFGLGRRCLDAEIEDIVVLSEDKKTITVKLPLDNMGWCEVGGQEEWERLDEIDNQIFNEDVSYGLLVEYTYKFDQAVEDFYVWTQQEDEGEGNEEPDYHPHW